MDKFEHEVSQVREALNQVSPSFCLAKWLQVTLHLHSGHNHSCHHPKTHLTPRKELERDPSALHNTEFKKKIRAQMKQGTRPKECEYCWDIENLGPQHLSDRAYKSASPWASPLLSRIATAPPTQNFNPTYVEVSFSNVCNFKCSYCSANFSTSWKEDLRKNGPYLTRAGEQTMKILEEEGNPYIEAFWKWWPDLVPDLQTFRITGGEPLMSPNTFRVMEYLSENPQPQMEFFVNSNFGAPEARFEKFMKLAKDLSLQNKVRDLGVFTSLDAWGSRAEYIRNGLQLDVFQKRVERFLSEMPQAKLTLMVTFNALSVTSFKDFLIYLKHLKQISRGGDSPRVVMDISYLRYPTAQSIRILTPDYLRHMEDCHQFLLNELEAGQSFTNHEVAKFERTYEWMKRAPEPWRVSMDRRNFFRFFSEHDERRKTDFLATFPEMEEFWNLCRSY